MARRTKTEKYPLFLVPEQPKPRDVAPCPVCNWVLVRIKHPTLGDLWVSQRSQVTAKFNKQEPEHRFVCTHTTQPHKWLAPKDPPDPDDPEWL